LKVTKQPRPYFLRLADYDCIHVLQGLLNPIRMGPSCDYGDSNLTVSVCKGVRSASEARKERKGDKIHVAIHRDRAYLLVDYFDVVIGWCQCRQMNACDWRYEIEQVTSQVSWTIADNNSYSHR
jgi:hypothetical protein